MLRTTLWGQWLGPEMTPLADFHQGCVVLCPFTFPSTPRKKNSKADYILEVLKLRKNIFFGEFDIFKEIIKVVNIKGKKRTWLGFLSCTLWFSLITR